MPLDTFLGKPMSYWLSVDKLNESVSKDNDQLRAENARMTAELEELRERISKAREAFYANFDAANAAITMIDILNDAEIPEPPEATDADN